MIRSAHTLFGSSLFGMATMGIATLGFLWASPAPPTPPDKPAGGMAAAGADQLRKSDSLSGGEFVWL